MVCISMFISHKLQIIPFTIASNTVPLDNFTSAFHTGEGNPTLEWYSQTSHFYPFGTTE